MGKEWSSGFTLIEIGVVLEQLKGAIKEDAIRFHLLSSTGRERGATKEGAILSRHGAKRS